MDCPFPGMVHISGVHPMGSILEVRVHFGANGCVLVHFVLAVGRRWQRCRSSTQRNSRNHYSNLAECQSARNARNQRAFRDRHAIAKAQAEKKGRE